MVEEKPTAPSWRKTAVFWLQRVLRPPRAVGAPVVVGGFALVAAVLTGRVRGELIVYGGYVLSGYALAITLAAAVRWIPRAHGAVMGFVERHERLARVRHDRVLRMRLALDGSFAVNVAYGVYMGFVGVSAASPWYWSLGIYYLAVAVGRLMLTHTIGSGLGLRAREVRAFRTCAVLVLVLDLALGAMATQMVLDGKQVIYEGYLIYVAAIYTFYSVGMAVVNMLRARKVDSPALQAVRALGVCTALVSVLSLQTAMFASFGAGEGGIEMQRTMNALTALCVCAAIAAVGVVMVYKGRHMGCE